MRRFEEASTQVDLILAALPRDDHRLERLAGDLVGIAARYRIDPDQEIYRWLRERAIRLWYAWGAQATSGGEGTAMSLTIREMERRLPEPR